MRLLVSVLSAFALLLVGASAAGSQEADVEVVAAAKVSRSDTSWLGFYPGHTGKSGLSDFARLEQWLGRDLGFMLQYGDGRSPDAFARNLGGQMSALRGGDFRLVYSLPMAFGARHTGSDATVNAIVSQWDALIRDTGGRRDFYRSAAQQLDDAGFGNAIIRLGWEFDNPSSRWHAGADPEKFKQAWRVIHDIFTSVSPGFTFDYNFVRVAASNEIVAAAYPGDAYVDIIGVDAYDSGYQGEGGVPAGARFGWSNPDLVWSKNQLPKLKVAEQFAKAHGKPMSVPEWALSTGGTSKAGKAGGDNPNYIQEMYDWMRHLDSPDGPGLVYATYFQSSGSPDGVHSIEAFPQSAALFQQLFGG